MDGGHVGGFLVLQFELQRVLLETLAAGALAAAHFGLGGRRRAGLLHERGQVGVHPGAAEHVRAHARAAQHVGRGDFLAVPVGRGQIDGRVGRIFLTAHDARQVVQDVLFDNLTPGARTLHFLPVNPVRFCQNLGERSNPIHSFPPLCATL
ncbi:hypothetical protein DEGR_00290 [Deinococcus grandis]|nr:hypothetical protein DEGR_00290 [Deinococcus grandis]